MFIFVSAQDVINTETSQKPLKEDFFYTWVTNGVSGKKKYSSEITFLNESSYFITTTFTRTKQNYVISSWEEVENTYTESEEYPYGFKISSKDTKFHIESIFAMFLNVDKTKFLAVIDQGANTQYYIYTKK